MGGIPSWAVPGSKVVCIRDFRAARPHNDKGYRTRPEENVVYAVARASQHADGRPIITLREFESDHWFDLSGFRPAVEDSDENGIEAQFYHKRGLKSKAPVRESERA